ncbi:DinB family protein [Chloroflexota bacterium]
MLHGLLYQLSEPQRAPLHWPSSAGSFNSRSDKITCSGSMLQYSHSGALRIRRVEYMELSDFIQLGLDRARQETLKAIDGLTYDELKWQPGPGSNSIGLILFHQARSEDSLIQTRIQGKPQVYESEKWYEKMDLPTTEVGSHYTVEQVNAFHVPEPKHLVAYGDAVRARTIGYLKGMTADEFDGIINLPRWGDIGIGAVFAFVVVHSAEHAGDISYLRGLQRGLDK